MKRITIIFALALSVMALFCACVGVSAPETLYISEVMSNNKSVVADENGKYCDWIEICNPTSTDINLKDYSLTDDITNIEKFKFDSVVIKCNDYIVVFADGTDVVDEKSGTIHVPFKLSSKKGETVQLYDGKHNLVSSLSVPLLEADTSFGIDENGKTAVFTDPTPGKANFPLSDEDIRESDKSTADKAELIINEYSTNKTQTITDRDGDFVSWVELYNKGENDIDLSGYCLSDSEDEPEKWFFPSGAKIKGKKYLVIFLSGKDVEYNGKGELHATFKLNGEESSLSLYSPQKAMVDSIKVYNLFSNLSCGIDTNGKLAFFSKATPGKKNTAAGFDSVDSAEKTKSKELVITEIAAVNMKKKSPDGEYRDYVEVCNSTKEPINLKNYKLSDSKKRESFQSLPSYVIKAGEYAVLWCADSSDISNGSIYINLGLDRYGDTIFLCDSFGVIIDSLTYSRLSNGYVCGRNLDGSDSPVYFFSYTPGKKNTGESLKNVLPNPSFSKSSTYVKKGDKVSISASDGEIRYTTDGSTPTEKSELYKEPISVKNTTVLRARCFKNGYVPSDTISATYLVGRKSSLDVVFLTTDSKNLYDYNTGIWADGPGYTDEFPHVGANYWKDWERPVTFEFMTGDGQSQVSFDAGISVFGQFSRAISQKSVAIKLRDKYGPKEICYPFFDDNDTNVFSSLVLRNSGQDFSYAHLRDAFCSQVIKGSIDVDFMDYKPVVCYINGEYHGIYDLREKIDEDYLENHHGVDSNTVDLIKGNNIINSGSIDEYRKLINYIKTHDVTDKKVYKYICSQIDIDELISYWMCESFFTNTDTGNIRFYKDKTKNSKWRWIFFDADWALFPSTYQLNYINNYLNPVGHGVSNAFSTTIMTNLIKNKDFRKRLIEIHAEHLKTTFDTKRMLKIYDSMVDEIDEEMEHHTKRWSTLSYDSWKKNTATLRSIIEKKRSIFIDDMIESFDLSNDEIALIRGK